MSIRAIKGFAMLTTIATLYTVGCSSTTSTTADATASEALEGAPEVAAVQMPLTGNAAADGTATEADAIDPQSLVADEINQADVPFATDAGDFQQIRQSAKNLNDSLRTFLGPVAAMVRNVPPSYEAGALRMWGPVVRGSTEYRVFLRHVEAHRWGWRLDARIDGTRETYSHVAAGELKVGSRVRRGIGVMGFDLDALAAVDPTVTAQGQILVGFSHGERGTSIGYAMRDFTADPSTKPGVDALMRAVHLKDGFNRTRLAYRGNVEGTATAAEELVFARLRHQRGVGGRSDLIVLEGDVPAGHALVISQCWNKELQAGFREVRNCPIDGLLGTNCVVTQTTGDVANCPASLTAIELPPADPKAPMADENDPNPDVDAPATFPEVDGDIPAGR